jgi:hypothetical protein
MPAKPVACEADVSATAGSVLYPGAASGAWTAGPVSVTPYAPLTVGGAATLAQATCLFSFTGTSPAPASSPVAGTSSLTLTPTATVLKFGGGNLLRDGDQAADSYGNTLAASSGRILASG